MEWTCHVRVEEVAINYLYAEDEAKAIHAAHKRK